MLQVQRGASAEAASPSRRPAHAVLVVATRYPPASGPGAQRVARTVQYLRELGWRPVVLTGQPASLPAARDVRPAPAEIDVLRVAEPVASDLLDWLRPLTRVAARATARWNWHEADWRAGLRWRMARWHERLSFPDRGVWRLRSALRTAVQLHRRHRFAAVFSSGMPFSDHLLALAIQSMIRRPWVAEFRDPWAEYPHAPPSRSALHRCATLWAEAAVVARARSVVAVSPEMTSRFRLRYPRQPAAKFVTVYNGFDPADFASDTTDADVRSPADLSDAFGPQRFTLIHAGSFYGGRRPLPLVQAFCRFIARDPARRGHARLVLAGRLGPEEPRVRAAVRDQPILLPGVVPHRRAIAWMQAAAACVLILAGGPGTSGDVSTKVFEYLAAARPIVAAVPPDGAAARLLSPFDGVWRTDPDDELGMLAAIEALYGRWRAGALHVRRAASALQPWTRRNQTARLARVLAAAARLGRTRHTTQESPHGR